jgi:hypothetical protein
MNEKLTLFIRTCMVLVWLCLGNVLCGQEATIDLELEGHKLTFEGAEAWCMK